MWYRFLFDIKKIVQNLDKRRQYSKLLSIVFHPNLKERNKWAYLHNEGPLQMARHVIELQRLTVGTDSAGMHDS